MIIFYYGPDNYRVQQKTNQTIHHYREKYHPAINLFILDFSQENYLPTFEQAIKNFSFFPEVKLIVVKHVFSQLLAVQSIADLIDSHNIQIIKDIVVVFQEEADAEQLTKSSKQFFTKINSDQNTVEYFPLLTSPGLSNWIKKECVSRGCSINPLAIQKLLALTGNDTSLIGNELDKLANYVGNHPITDDDIKLLTTTKTDLNIFDLIDSLTRKDKSKTLILLSQEIDQGRDPYYILTMIIYQFRTLLIVKDLAQRGFTPQAIAKKASIHLFVARKTYNQIKQFPMESLFQMYQNLLTLDTNSKNGLIDLTLMLHDLVLRV